jgi:hypothetical protein
MSTHNETQLRISQAALLISQAVKDQEINAKEAVELLHALQQTLEAGKHE